MTVEKIPATIDAQMRDSLKGKDIALRHFASPDALKKEWGPWAERMGVRRLITEVGGYELWPSMDPKAEQQADQSFGSEK